jgi:hydantoinase/carbamoylase family amidase
MSISADRIKVDIDSIAGFTQTPGEGATRPTFSPAWRAARDYVAQQLEAAGCKVRIDAAGNLRARPAAISFDTPAWMSGSHVDTVPHGGNYDGVAGVVAAMEVLRSSREAQKAIPLELVVWAEEEGTTFNLGMIGSRAATGALSADQLATVTNAAGQNYQQAGAQHGVVPEKLAADRIASGKYIGLIEIHVEQGPGLWNDDAPLAIVNAVAGRRQYSCTLVGAANHAGSTSMEDRLDALAGAADVIVSLEKLARELAHHTVITVGQIGCRPNAINVIAEEVTFTIDFRSPSTEILARGDLMIQSAITKLSEARRLMVSLQCTESQTAVEFDKRICDRLSKAATKCMGHDVPHTVSGALHDAVILAPIVPTAMLFVASRDGISHNPDEFSRIEDITAAATVLAEAVRNRTLD